MCNVSKSRKTSQFSRPDTAGNETVAKLNPGFTFIFIRLAAAAAAVISGVGVVVVVAVARGSVDADTVGGIARHIALASEPQLAVVLFVVYHVHEVWEHFPAIAADQNIRTT